MEITWPKIVALVLSVPAAVLMLAGMGISPDALVMVLAWPVFPLSLIWFPEYVGSITGYIGGGIPGYVGKETAGCWVSAFGWFFLIGMPVVLWLVPRCGAS